MISPTITPMDEQAEIQALHDRLAPIQFTYLAIFVFCIYLSYLMDKNGDPFFNLYIAPDIKLLILPVALISFFLMGAIRVYLYAKAVGGFRLVFFPSPNFGQPAGANSYNRRYHMKPLLYLVAAIMICEVLSRIV